MRKIDQFTNQYPLNKTLRFKLLPVGKTEENFRNKLLLEQDEQRAKDYVAVKKLIDRYHKDYIERTLKDYCLEYLSDYAELYFKSNRTPEDNVSLEKIADKMRKSISKQLQKGKEYGELFKKEMIQKLLPAFLEDETEIDVVNRFAKFTTYFIGFHENRKNMYSGEGKSTEIAFRLINQNLPKFLDNVKTGKIVREKLPKEKLDQIESDFAEVFSFDIKSIFDVEHFHHVLTQSGIDEYNQILGGYTKKDGTKIQGYNEYINLYNQQHKSARIPQLKPLYKQILSDRSTLSFIEDKFNSADDLLSSVNAFYTNIDDETEKSIEKVTSQLNNLFANLSQYNPKGIFITSGLPVSSISNAVFGHWSVLQDAFYTEYDSINEKKKKKAKDIEKYEDERRKALKRIESFSIADLQEKGEAFLKKTDDNSDSNEKDDSGDTKKVIKTIEEYASETVKSDIESIINLYAKAKPLLTASYPEGKRLYQENDDIALIKDFLDSVKELQRFLKIFLGSGKEEEKDELFYGEFLPLYDQLNSVTPLYNKVRNYMTQKPYSEDKIKLNFENAELLAGWDENKESAHAAVILLADDKYYLAIMDKNSRTVFENAPAPDGEEAFYQKMIYKLLPDPKKMLPKVFFSKKCIDFYSPSNEILGIRERGSYKYGDTFDLDDCHTFIDFYKDSIAKHSDWRNFGFGFTPTSDYNNINEFFSEVKNQGYKIDFGKISKSYIKKMIEEGKLYLFQIYNKDFSSCSKGTPNLHTMYFKALFDPENLRDVVYALNGKAELFYRKPSIKKENAVVHPANEKLKNKNPLNKEKTSCFSYDIMKDRRYTEYQFSFHVPITLNFTAGQTYHFNQNVRKALWESECNYVIGIDRGERNLLYISVVDNEGNIVEQYSLNQIINEYNGQKYVTDYHDLLDKKEKEHAAARQNWTTIENIKELKEGYISQVVHKICLLVEKYDAIIAMEDLNSGFKNSRVKVEKQVYQKFEKMLIDKLNYYVNKNKESEEFGGLYHAYQLTDKFESFARMGKQNGFIFYVPAWLTSKIDPTTGFVDLLKPKTSMSKDDAKSFYETFDDIRYNTEEDYFEFALNYDNFSGGSKDYRKNWVLCSYGKRIQSFRNPEKNSEWDCKTVDLTAEFKKVFDEYRIDYKAEGLQNKICEMDEKAFFAKLTRCMSLLLQMRNSETGTDIDYLISPVKNEFGKFYCSNDYAEYDNVVPKDADANGAYHIARKAQWAIAQIKNHEYGEIAEKDLAISNKEWLKYIQSGR